MSVQARCVSSVEQAESTETGSRAVRVGPTRAAAGLHPSLEATHEQQEQSTVKGRANQRGFLRGDLASAHWLRAGRLLVLFGLGGALLASNITLCPTAGFWGVPCPGCGLSRASLLLLSGDLAGAISLQPLIVLVLPAVLLFSGQQILGYVRGPVRVRRLPVAVQQFGARAGGPRFARAVSQLLSWFAIALALALLVIWVARFFGHFGGPVPVRRWY